MFMSWGIVAFTVIGAGVGAAVGESQNAGGWKKGAIIGGAVGFGGAYAAGAGAFGGTGALATTPGAGFAAPMMGGAGGFMAPGTGAASTGVGAGTGTGFWGTMASGGTPTAAQTFGTTTGSGMAAQGTAIGSLPGASSVGGLGTASTAALPKGQIASNFVQGGPAAVKQGAAVTQAAGPAAPTAGKGLGLGNLMSIAGMGLQAAQAFGGGQSGGGANIIEKIPLTHEEEQNKQRVLSLSDQRWRDAQQGRLNSNLTSPHIKRFIAGTQGLRKIGNQTANVSGAMAASSSGSTKGVAGPAGVKAIVKASEAKGLLGLRKGSDLMNVKRERLTGAVAHYKNFLSMERQVGAQEYGAQLYQTGIEQKRKAEQGAALGQIASMGGLMAYQNMRSA
jgi:hypothetical protein